MILTGKVAKNKPLPIGTYYSMSLTGLVRWECRMHKGVSWVKAYRGRRMVFECNELYAQYNYDLFKRISK